MYEHMDRCMDIQMDVHTYRQMYRHMDACIDTQTCQITLHMSAQKGKNACTYGNTYGSVFLFKAKLSTAKRTGNIREPPDHTGNEPTLDILIGGSG